MERKYQQQLDIDRQQIIAQIDAIYTHKLQQVLAKMRSGSGLSGTAVTGSQLLLEQGFHHQ